MQFLLLVAIALPGIVQGVTIYRFGGEDLPPPPEADRPGVEFRQLSWTRLGEAGSRVRISAGQEIAPLQHTRLAPLPLLDFNPPRLAVLFDTNEEHYFTNPDGMIRGEVVDPKLTLDNPDIVRRHIRAFLLQSYHQKLTTDQEVWGSNPYGCTICFIGMGAGFDMRPALSFCRSGTWAPYRPPGTRTPPGKSGLSHLVPPWTGVRCRNGPVIL